MTIDINEITTTFSVQEIKVFDASPEVTNVVGKVVWQCVLAYRDISILAGGETFLEYKPDQPFVPITELTQQQIMDWVIQTLGGAPFLQHYKENHAIHLELAYKEKNMRVWEQPIPQ